MTKEMNYLSVDVVVLSIRIVSVQLMMLGCVGGVVMRRRR